MPNVPRLQVETFLWKRRTYLRIESLFFHLYSSFTIFPPDILLRSVSQPVFRLGFVLRPFSFLYSFLCLPHIKAWRKNPSRTDAASVPRERPAWQDRHETQHRYHSTRRSFFPMNNHGGKFSKQNLSQFYLSLLFFSTIDPCSLVLLYKRIHIRITCSLVDINFQSMLTYMFVYRELVVYIL